MSEPVGTSHYDAAAGHLRAADEQNRTSHDSALDLQRAQVHALLAIADELRLLRASVNELAKDVSSSVGGLDQEHGSLRNIANAALDIAERLPR